MKQRLFLSVAVVVLLGFTFLGSKASGPARGNLEGTFAATEEPTEAQGGQVLFDDFAYKSGQDLPFAQHGWIARTEVGWPGIAGAKWPADELSFVDDPDSNGNRLMQINASTDGTTVNQAQVCQQRKFLTGTYASRVRFTDSPASGPDGDQVVETFYMISPFKAAMDPDYSEMDFEYLPNGGWGDRGNIFHMTTWYTFRPEPNWYADNINNHIGQSFEGWHMLVLQVADGHVKYYIDGKQLADHSGKYFPRVPMSINYNLWFIQDGGIHSNELRKYEEQIDWVYFAANVVLSPDEINAKVADLRAGSVSFIDSVPAQTPLLDSPCNL